MCYDNDNNNDNDTLITDDVQKLHTTQQPTVNIRRDRLYNNLRHSLGLGS